MKRILVFAAVGLVLIIASLVLVNSTNKDETRPLLAQLYGSQLKVSQLCEQAINRGSANPLKAVAASIHVVSLSDAASLSSYYKTRYGKAPAVPKLTKTQQAADPLTVLKDTEDGIDFDTKYKQLVSEQLEASVNTSKTVLALTNNAELREILNTHISNGNSALEQLKQLN